DAALEAEERMHATYGVAFEAKDARGLGELEPHLSETFVGGILRPQPASVADPSAVGKAYAELLTRSGGRFVSGDARTLQQTATGWRGSAADQSIDAPEAVIALGAWSDDVLARHGV